MVERQRNQEGSHRKGRRSAFTWNAWNLPQGQHRAPLRGPPWGSSSSSRKREPKVDTQHPHIAGCLPEGPLRSHLTGLARGMCSLTTDGEGGRAYSNQHSDSSGLRSSLQQPPVDIPARGLPLCRAEPIAPPGQKAWSSALSSLDIKPTGSTSVDPILWPCLGRETNS